MNKLILSCLGASLSLSTGVSGATLPLKGIDALTGCLGAYSGMVEFLSDKGYNESTAIKRSLFIVDEFKETLKQELKVDKLTADNINLTAYREGLNTWDGIKVSSDPVGEATKLGAYCSKVYKEINDE